MSPNKDLQFCGNNGDSGVKTVVQRDGQNIKPWCALLSDAKSTNNRCVFQGEGDNTRYKEWKEWKAESYLPSGNNL